MIATYPLSFFVDFLIFSNKIYFGARWVDDWDQWKKIEPKKIMIRRRGSSACRIIRTGDICDLNVVIRKPDWRSPPREKFRPPPEKVKTIGLSDGLYLSMEKERVLELTENWLMVLAPKMPRLSLHEEVCFILNDELGLIFGHGSREFDKKTRLWKTEWRQKLRSKGESLEAWNPPTI